MGCALVRFPVNFRARGSPIRSPIYETHPRFQTRVHTPPLYDHHSRLSARKENYRSRVFTLGIASLANTMRTQRANKFRGFDGIDGRKLVLFFNQNIMYNFSEVSIETLFQKSLKYSTILYNLIQIFYVVLYSTCMHFDSLKFSTNVFKFAISLSPFIPVTYLSYDLCQSSTNYII